MNEPFLQVFVPSAIIMLSAMIGVFIVSSAIPFSYAQLDEPVSAAENSTSESFATGNWTTFTSDVFGISFDYPSTWNVEEKGNRFDAGADVAVSNGDIRFSAFKVLDRPEDNPLKTSALAFNTRMIQDGVEKGGQDTIIEATDVKKYKIGGERAGTFVTKHDDGTFPPSGVQTFFVTHNGDGYMIIFRAPTETFDTPETQVTMNKMIKSFKFLN